MRGMCLGDEGLQIFEARDIQRNRLDVAAFGTHFVLQGGEPVQAARADVKVVALPRQMAGRGLADATAGAGEHDDLGGDRCGGWHGFSLCILGQRKGSQGVANKEKS